VRLVLRPSLIAQIPAFSVMEQDRRNISLAVDFLSPAERHAGLNALWLSPFQRALIFLCGRVRLFVHRGFSRKGVNPLQSNPTGLKLLSQSPRLMSDTATAH
jgi:hypothetical protein